MKHRSPRAALLGLAACMCLLGHTAEEVAHTLEFLHAGIRALVKDAIKSGELRAVDTNRLARMVQATLNGSVLQWTIHREGTLKAWVRRDLQMVLGAFSPNPQSPIPSPR